jgi:hypothetical protein
MGDKKMDRGVIAAPGIIIPQNEGFMMERSISAEEIRYYVMYWDKVVIPGNNLVYIGIPEEEQLLASGAISRPRVAFRGSFGGDQVTAAILSCQSIVAEKLIPETSTDWVVHQIGNELAFPSELSTERNVVRVALAGSLPVPVAETPIANILEFKERRRDELRELHDALDEMYLSILSTPDHDLATKRAVARLKESISNLESAASERFQKSKKYDLEVQLNLSGKDVAAGASAGALIDFFTNGFTIPLATVAGAALSAIKIGIKAVHTFSPAANKQKLAYLCHAAQEHLIDMRS